MKPDSRNMIAEFIKQGRLAKGYTQKELSELSHVSIRSIQRIESGDLIPRSYTLKTLSGTLDIPFEALNACLTEVATPPIQKENPASGTEGNREDLQSRKGMNRSQRRILSVGLVVVVALLTGAYLAQSSRFPETQFELFLFLAGITVFTGILLFLTWRQSS